MREGWRETTLGEVAGLTMGQSPPGSSYNTEGRGIPFIQGSAEFGAHHPRPLKWCDAPKKIAQCGDLLVSVRAPVGDLNFAVVMLAIGRGLAVVRGTTVCSTEILALMIEHERSNLKSRSGGGMFESATRAGLAGLPILLPPLDEQRRIVDLIAAVDEAIEAAEQAVRSFRSGISVMGEELIERSNLSPLSDLVSIEAPLVDPKRSQYEGMSYLDIEAIQSRTGVIRSLTTVGEAAPISAKFLFASDDVIYSKIRPELRKVALPRTEGLCSADAYPLRAGPRMLPEYLFEVLLTEGFSVEAVKKSGRTKMPKVNRGELLSIEVPAPDLATQHRVSRLLGSLRLAASNVAAYVTALRSLRSALLADLLSGDHEIPTSYDALLSA